ncbi:MAG: ATP-dependent zinc protease [Bradymonadaceae bacterium]|nr:ATP-dependent zinc protease [Lujinxingiaceae bacterium]
MSPSRQTAKQKKVIGWREWLCMPDLHIDRIKAKIDTGARTSVLHALDIKRFERDGVQMVRFRVHPLQRNTSETSMAEAVVQDEREVRSSNGQVQLRLVIRTRVEMGEDSWPIDLTLTNRDVMGFRMLLGREALRGRFLIDVGRSFLAGQLPEPWDRP